MNRPLRVLAIHDLSGFGRCSLTVIIPSLSAMGMQVCPVPTAVFSTHLGGFGEVSKRDLTNYIPLAYEHYKKLDLELECIYTGFLSCDEQIDSCLSFFSNWKKALKVVDPVMGDNGRTYVSSGIVARMKEMVRCADVITPNLTEAKILINEEYDCAPMTHEKIKSMLSRLSALGPKKVIITGVSLLGGPNRANVAYDKERGAFWLVSCDYVPASYPGTGDLFASVLTGSLLWGDSLPIALNRATDFVEVAVKTTYGYGSNTKHGVMLESILDRLTKRTVLSSYEIL